MHVCTAVCGRGHIPECVRNTSVCVCRRIHGNVLVCMSLLCCLRIRSFRITLPGERLEGRGEQLAVTLVPRTSSEPMWQLKLDLYIPSASSNSYKSLQQSEAINWPAWPARWTLVSFVTSGKLAGWWVHMYNSHPNFEIVIYGENCAYYNQIFTVHGNGRIIFLSSIRLCIYVCMPGQRYSPTGLLSTRIIYIVCHVFWSFWLS